MRHGNKVNALGRTKSHRDALMKNMASSLIEHKRITTTLAKAKALRAFVEPLVTKAKNNTTHSRRVVFTYLQNKVAVDTLFSEINEKVGSRPGGYLRILKLGNRSHDAAEMALIEFVDFNTLYNPNEASEAKKSRSRRGSKKKSTTPAAEKTAEPVAAAPEVTEVVAEEVEAAPEVVETVAEVIEDVPATVEVVADEVEAEVPAVEEVVAEVSTAEEVVAEVTDVVEAPAVEEIVAEAESTEESTDEATESEEKEA